MSSRQLYRTPSTPEKIREELTACSGSQWDPEIVDLALSLIDSGELVLGADGLHLLEPALVVLPAPGLAVLLVESDDEQARLSREALEAVLEGAVIVRASSVAGAAELLTSSTWSIAIVDQLLPDGEGVEVLDALRAHEPWRSPS